MLYTREIYMNDLQLLICNENKIPRDFFVKFLIYFFRLHPEIADQRNQKKYLNFLLKNIYGCKITNGPNGIEFLTFKSRKDKVQFLLKFNT